MVDKKKEIERRQLQNMAHKHVESEIFAIFPVEVSKTGIATNCDHSKNYVQLMPNLQY